ncbi:MAG: hypothetical protein AAGC55_01810 [Myxococcota bacterium]
MKRYTVIPILVAAMLALGACLPTTFSSGTPAGVTYRTWNNFYLFGLVGNAWVDAATLCPTGVARVETRVGIGQVLLGVITIGLYVPRTVIVSCAAPVASDETQPKKFWIGQNEQGETVYVVEKRSDDTVEFVYQNSAQNGDSR